MSVYRIPISSQLMTFFVASSAIFLGACGPTVQDSDAVVASNPSELNEPQLASSDLSTMYTDEELRTASGVLETSETAPRARRSLFQATPPSEVFAEEPVDVTATASTTPSPTSAPFTANPSVEKAAEAPTFRTIKATSLASLLNAAASDADDPVPAQFVRALLPLVSFALNQKDIAVDDFERRDDLTESEQQMLQQVASFASTARERLEKGDAAREVLEDELARLLEAIRVPETFSIANAELATHIRGLGDFTSRENNTFTKGQNHEVRIYMDFDGVHWNFDGMKWSTELQLQIQVLKADGFRVHATEWESLRDSRARRIGVFAWSSITLADDLEIGEYAVKVRVRQPDSNQLSERLIPIQIVSRLAQVGS